MIPFMSKDFLLDTEAAKILYHNYAAKMPIIDYHCHVSPKEIWENRRFENITEVWLGGDHYKWRLMRSNGVDEYYITGDASPREKFQKFAETLPRAIGNPIYHWCHFELKKYFGYEGTLNGNTAQEVWDLAIEVLKKPESSVRGLIAQSNVAFVGTTDDPIDSLEWHKKLANDDSIKTIIAPSFRPDNALNIDKKGWLSYVKALSNVSNIDINGIDSLEKAIGIRIDYFNECGCKSSDHGLDFMIYNPVSREEVDAIVKKGLAGEDVSADEAAALKTTLLKFCAAQYARLGWVMQIHYNCIRNPNSVMFEKLGADTGFDCVGPNNGSRALAAFLDDVNRESGLPRTILYSLDSGDNTFLDTLIGAFQGPETAGKMQHGSGWWFNDTYSGMRDQLTSLANLSVLGNFVGMLTDSRSFLSYTRHEYFRRILCQLIGSWVENGQYPADMEFVGSLVQDICYNNAYRYFRIGE